jgi:hypothetical protein
VILAVIALRPVFTFDSYWHLQMGRDLIENGLSPWIDHYSFSYPGNEIATVPIIFQLLLSQSVILFGESNGFYFIKLLYVTLLMSVLFIYFRKIKASWMIIFLLLPIITYLVQLRLMIRPEIFSNVLIVVCLLLYLRAQKSFATKELLYICMLLLFWVNYHSPVFGYVIIFGLFLDKAVNKIITKDDSFSWLQWCLWGGIVFLIGFVRPGGQHFAIGMLNTMSQGFSKHVLEFAPSYTSYSTDMVVHISWVLSVYVAIWSLIKRQYGFAFIAALLTYLSWSTLRLVAPTSLINLCVLAYYFSQVSSDHLVNIRASVKKTIIAAAACMSLLALYSVSQVALVSIKSNENKLQVLETQYPIHAVEYLKQYQDGGNILNNMSSGGFLINKLSPDFKVFIDGRTNILYPIDFVEDYVTLLTDTNRLSKTIDDYDVDYVLYDNSPEKFIAIHNARKADLVFADENYILFAKEKSQAFPLSSKLLVFPSCWSDGWALDIKSEISQSERLFADKDYSIKLTLAMLDDYLGYEDKQQFFDALQPESMRSDAIRRVALHLALNDENFGAASDLFSSIHKKGEYDILFYAYHMVNNKNYVDAENLVHYFFELIKLTGSNDASLEKIALVIHVLETLENNNKLGRFSPSLRAGLEKKLQPFNVTAKDILTFDHLCK